MDPEAHEERLQADQDGRLYPLGRALRSTFDADNHHTLGSDVTGLMIDLSKVPFEAVPAPLPAPLPATPPAPLPARSDRHSSILARLTGLIARR